MKNSLNRQIKRQIHKENRKEGHRSLRLLARRAGIYVLPYVHLMRLDKPVGTFLLLWPTLWALWFAGDGIPSLQNMFIFLFGVALMRSAGCIINDFADRKIDGKVGRTAIRPLVTGQISVLGALMLFAVLVLSAFYLVLMTDEKTVKLSVVALVLAVLYPFSKRFTYYPQIFLGVAFAWAIPMAYSAQLGYIERDTWMLFLATMVWTVAYDTHYAMADRTDDRRAGIKSIAIVLGDLDRVAALLLQMMMVTALFFAGKIRGLSIIYYSSLLVVTAIFLWQFFITRSRQADKCLRAFRSNAWVGAIIFASIFVHYSLYMPMPRDQVGLVDDSELFLDALPGDSSP